MPSRKPAGSSRKMSKAEDLYHKIIIQHNKAPLNAGHMESCTHRAEGYNPVCGDQLIIYLKVKRGVIENITVEADTCAIARASASMMTDKIKGKSIEEFEELRKEFEDLLAGRLDPDRDAHELGDLKYLVGVRKYPNRLKCADLAWQTLKGALEGTSSVTTE